MPTKSIAELFNLTGATAIVTGGAAGIGFGIARRLAEAGANVVIADITESTGKKKAAELGDNALFIKTDVSSEKDVKNLVAQTVKKFGGLDIFVNNAGIFPQSPVLQMDTALWEKIQAINLRGVFLCSRHAGEVMAKNKSGCFVNIASIDALHPSNVGLAAYDASKHGVWGFTKNFALEMAAYDVRVNAIAPGGVETEGVAALAKQAGTDVKTLIKNFATTVPLKRFGQPDDIATAALFLASPAASYITGAMIVVDGGVLLT